MPVPGEDRSELLRQVDLLAQRRALSAVLRAIARSEGLQPVLDEVVDAADPRAKPQPPRIICTPVGTELTRA